MRTVAHAQKPKLRKMSLKEWISGGGREEDGDEGWEKREKG
jgi:hypothetical protein